MFNTSDSGPRTNSKPDPVRNRKDAAITHIINMHCVGSVAIGASEKLAQRSKMYQVGLNIGARRVHCLPYTPHPTAKVESIAITETT